VTRSYFGCVDVVRVVVNSSGRGYLPETLFAKVEQFPIELGSRSRGNGLVARCKERSIQTLVNNNIIGAPTNVRLVERQFNHVT
jgi:hypothetical protein